MTRARVAILGASGYAGGELLRLLLEHPAVEVAYCSSEQQAGVRASEVLTGLRNHPAAREIAFGRLADLPPVDVAFNCLPHGVLPASLERVRASAELVISLAGDYRLSGEEELRRHYPASLEHPRPDAGCYFVPELGREPPRRGVLSLPGCMAGAAIYALYPLWSGGLVEPYVVADLKTGSSGSGKGASEHVAERDHNFRPHRLHGHRHGPEVVEALAGFRPEPLELQFSTHSLDLARGVFATVYTRLRPGVSALDVRRAFVKAYLRAPFVHVLQPGKGRFPWPMLKAVAGTNSVEVGFSVEGSSCVVVSCLDNLVKGAAGQAVQALNLVLGCPEQLGLPLAATWP